MPLSKSYMPGTKTNYPSAKTAFTLQIGESIQNTEKAIAAMLCEYRLTVQQLGVQFLFTGLDDALHQLVGFATSQGCIGALQIDT